MDVYKYALIENIATIISCAACVVGLAAFTEGYWGWGFLLLININIVKSGK